MAMNQVDWRFMGGAFAQVGVVRLMMVLMVTNKVGTELLIEMNKLILKN